MGKLDPEATTTFTAITQDPTSLTLDSLHMSRLARLTVGPLLMFSKNCAAQSVNEARKLMFTHGLKSLDSIPPNQNASSSMPSGLFTKQDSSGSSPSRESRRSQIPVTGAGNGMPETTSGCHIGRICQTSARLARCSSNAGVWLHTASVIELDYIAVHYASVKAAALTMKVKCDVHATLLFLF